MYQGVFQMCILRCECDTVLRVIDYRSK